ncbi:MAG: hypothetical protein AMK71_08035 [Nitrospira bacterium SG8_35_4]|nr:MAG: hypothetical protein AMK71_08035 [Nitrospira bacterium SG8_35_4]
MTAEDKFNRLKENLKKMERAIIAFSGGVDSTFLLKAASASGLRDVLAVTGVSESLPHEELTFAREMTSTLKINHREIVTDELNDKRYADNPPDRCYYCKKELFGKLKDIAVREKYSYILDGSNVDDSRDWRPGRRAAREEGVCSPLLDAGLNKDEIRTLSRLLGLPTWDKPATPCLSSRFPYGQKITLEGLGKVYQAEQYIRQFGIKELRVRNHADVARIEINSDDFRVILEDDVRERIVDHLKSLGFRYVTLDLQGFRSGSGNEVLSDQGIKEDSDSAGRDDASQ